MKTADLYFKLITTDSSQLESEIDKLSIEDLLSLKSFLLTSWLIPPIALQLPYTMIRDITGLKDIKLFISTILFSMANVAYKRQAKTKRWFLEK